MNLFLVRPVRAEPIRVAISPVQNPRQNSLNSENGSSATPLDADDAPRPAEREDGQKRGGGDRQRLRLSVCKKRLHCVQCIRRVLYYIRRAARKWRNARIQSREENENFVRNFLARPRRAGVPACSDGKTLFSFFSSRARTPALPGGLKRRYQVAAPARSRRLPLRRRPQ